MAAESHDQKCVKMVDFVKIWKNHVNSFKNLLLQTNQSDALPISEILFMEA